MKLFTVSEPLTGDGLVQPGIRIFPSELPMGLRWGAAVRNDSKIVPLSKAQYRAVQQWVKAKSFPPDKPCHLVRADVVDAGPKGLKFDIEKDERDQRAFIYVHTNTLALMPPVTLSYGAPDDAVRNTVTFTSNEARHVDSGRGPFDRVSRSYQPFSEAKGIDKLGVELVSEMGTSRNEALLVVQPNASFRVVRGGDTRELVPEFIVVWTGHKLRTIIPERYRSRMQSFEDRRLDHGP